MIILGVQSSDELIAGLGNKYLKAHKEALYGSVEDYHDKLFPRHFFNSNRSRYKLAPRTSFYLKKIKPRKGVGTGRFVDLVLKGVSMRRMMSFYTIRQADGGNSLVLRMQAPRYFTERYRGQPDKKAEAEQINDDDREKIRGFYIQRMQAKWQQLKQKRSRKV